MSTASAWLSKLALVLATIVVYADSFTTSFHLDDGHMLLDRDRISSLETYLALQQNRPFAALTFWLNALVARPGPYHLQDLVVTGDLVPWPYHVVNLAIHLAAGLTLFGLVRRTLRLSSVPGRLHGSADGLAFAIALLWLVHPLNTMAVTYITQRCESMMGLFFLVTIYAFLRASQSPEPRLWQLASILAALLGSATKEVMITLPAVLLVYDRTFLAADWRTVLRRDGGYLGLIAAACWVLPVFVHLVAFGAADNAAAIGAGALVSRLTYMQTQTTVLPHYLRLCVSPSDLSFEYRDWYQYPDWKMVWPYLLGVGLALAVTAYGAIRGRWYGFLGTWFFAILSLTSLVPIIDFVAEYRMYLPLMAVIAGLVLGGEWLLSFLPDARVRKTIAIALVAGIAMTLGVFTWMRNADYATEITLWTRNLVTRPEDAKAYMHLAMAHEQLGDFDEAARLYETSFEKAHLHFLPEAHQRWTSLQLLHGKFVKLGDPVFTIAPSIDEAYYLSILQADAGDPEGALLRIAALQKKHPHLSPLKMLEAQLLAEQGKAKESEAALAEALAIFPGYADWAQAKARMWLTTPYFANPIGRRMALAFAQQAVLASHGEDAGALDCLAAAKRVQ
jgi:protein O-mannosyl-transferase